MDIIETQDHRCGRCGGLLMPEGDKLVCPYCKKVYDIETAEKNTETLKSLLDSAKMEIVHNLRGNLYRATTARYISAREVKDLCVELKKYLPDDFEANFFEVTAGNNIKAVTNAIRRMKVEEHYDDMEHIIGFLFRSIDSDRDFLLELNNLVERAFKTRDLKLYHKYATELAELAERVKEGVYVTSYPRNAFIAYSSSDMVKVSELVEELEAQGIECFVAVRNLRHGMGSVENYDSALKEAMDSCTTIVFVSSRNSRNFGCDAVRVELAYIKHKDIENAPAELRNHYTHIPHKYKKPRVEYRIEESDRKGNAADRIVDEFFDGYERVYTPSDVAYRILQQESEVPSLPPDIDFNQNEEEKRRAEAARAAKEKADREAAAKAAREAKEKAAQEAKAKADREAAEKAARAAKEKADREAAAKAAREAKEKAAQEAKEEKQRQKDLQSAEASKDDAPEEKSRKRVIPLVVIVVALLCAAGIGGGVMLAGKKPNPTPPVDPIVTIPLPDSESEPDSVVDSETLFESDTETETTPENPYSEGLAFTENEDGTYSVSGIGACTDTTLYIPPTHQNKPVTRIATEAFRENKQIQMVVLPESMQVIEYWAFGLCTSLTSVTIPEGVTTIEGLAFQHCPLTSISIPDSVTSIGEGAFAGCAPILTEIQIGSNNAAYRMEGSYLIETATQTLIVGLQLGEIPDGIKQIGEHAFVGLTDMTAVTLPSSLESIGFLAFDNCASLTDITFQGTKEQWTAIVKAEDWDRNTPDYVVYCADGSIPEIITYSEGLSFKLKTNATYNVSGMGSCTDTDVLIPPTYEGKQVTSIGVEAFKNCATITSVTIPRRIGTISKGAFYNCDALKSITIQGGVTYISMDAFTGCDSLTDIYYESTMKKWDSIVKENGWYESTSKIVIHCTDGDITTQQSVAHYSFDELRRNGEEGDRGIFAPGASDSWDHQATVDENTKFLNYYGWLGYNGELGTFGYQIDNEPPIYDSSFAISADQGIIDAAHGFGAESATRMDIGINIFRLGGTHTVRILYKDMFDHQKVLTEFELTRNASQILTPDQANMIQYNIDMDHFDNYSASIAGWVGFSQPITKLGYSVDSNNITWISGGINTEPQDMEEIEKWAGEHAIRFGIQADLSIFPHGNHIVSFYVCLQNLDVVELYSMMAVTVDTDEITDTTMNFDSSRTPDLSEFFVFVDGLNGYQCDYTSAPYKMSEINELVTQADGTYTMTIKNFRTENGHAAVFLRGRPDPNFGDSNYFGHDGNNDLSNPDSLSVGCAGIYVGIEDASGIPTLRINVKGTEDDTTAIPHIFKVPMSSRNLTIRDDNDTIRFYEGSKLLATVDLNGNLKGYATEAVVTLADGTTETLTDVCAAASVVSDIGFVARRVELTFDAFTFKSVYE